MAERHSEGQARMDGDAYRMFSQGLYLMLFGVLLSVIALILLPAFGQESRVPQLIGGLGILAIAGLPLTSGRSRRQRQDHQ